MIEGVMYVLTAVIVTIGIATAVWSFIDTRNRYYKEYLERKRK